MGELIDDKYLAASWSVIDNLKPGEIIIVSDYAPNKPDLFISCIKQRIDTLKDCEFSNNYKKVKKLNLF